MHISSSKLFCVEPAGAPARPSQMFLGFVSVNFFRLSVDIKDLPSSTEEESSIAFIFGSKPL